MCTGQLAAQDLTEMTLDFENITATNIVQMPENTGLDEKEIDFGDYDNDGDIDVVIAVGQSDFNERRNKLYRNDNGVLVEVSGAPVIPGFASVDVGRSAFFRDYNGDGLLDIIVICDSNSGTATLEAPGRTKLYIQSANGTFVNMSNDLEVSGGSVDGAACNGVSEDFDGNGLPDLMLCNYPNISQDSMTMNGVGGNAPGVFAVMTNTMYPAEFEYGVHSEGADMNGDGQIDLLIANWTGDPSFIYYNNNNNAGSGQGDFRYAGVGANTSFPAIGGGDERAMVPADFNGDGMMDFYFANFGTPGRTDHLFINTGNDANNRAMFASQPFFSVHNNETNKVTCSDLDGDGMADIIVMRDNTRPFIYRNVSAGSEVRFVEWTPANITTTLQGWQANSADITGNGRADVMFGGNNNDHLFESVETSVIDFDSLNSGVLPNFGNTGPIAVSGTIADGETKTLIALGGATGVAVGSTFSVIARSDADISVSLLVGGNTVATSDRAGAGVIEGLQAQAATNNGFFIEVTSSGGGGTLLGDVNGDGAVNLLDIQPFVDLIATGQFNAGGDLNGDGVVNLLDVQPFVDALSGGGTGGGPADFVIEFNSRTT